MAMPEERVRQELPENRVNNSVRQPVNQSINDFRQTSRFSDYADNQRGKKNNQEKRKIFRLLFVVTVIITASIASVPVYRYFFLPFFVIKNISLNSDLPLPIDDQQFLQSLGVNADSVWFTVDTEQARLRLLDNPLIRQASVEKVFPDKLVITVQSRTALVAAIAEVDGRAEPLYFSDDGILFQIGSQPEVSVDVPLISGLSFGQIAPGIRLPDKIIDYLGSLMEFSANFPQYSALISEMRFIAIGSERYEVFFYFRDSHFAVRFGEHLEKDMFVRYLMAVSVINRQGIIDKVEEIDVRTEDVVYRLKSGGDSYEIAE